MWRGRGDAGAFREPDQSFTERQPLADCYELTYADTYSGADHCGTRGASASARSGSPGRAGPGGSTTTGSGQSHAGGALRNLRHRIFRRRAAVLRHRPGTHRPRHKLLHRGGRTRSPGSTRGSLRAPDLARGR